MTLKFTKITLPRSAPGVYPTFTIPDVDVLSTGVAIVTPAELDNLTDTRGQMEFYASVEEGVGVTIKGENKQLYDDTDLYVAYSTDGSDISGGGGGSVTGPANWFLSFDNDGNLNTSHVFAQAFEDTNFVTIGRTQTTGTDVLNLAVGASATYSNPDSKSIALVVDGTEVGHVNATNVSLGPSSNAQGANSIAIGGSAAANGADAVVIGSGANTTTAINGVAVGNSASVSGDNGVAIGPNCTAPLSGSVGLGNTAGGSGQDSVAIGSSVVAEAQNSIAIGTNADAEEASAIAIGNVADAADQYSIAIGDSTFANLNCVTIGKSASTNNTDCVAIGNGANTTTFINSIALGAGATTGAAGAVSIGQGVGNTLAHSVAIGSNGVTGVVIDTDKRMTTVDDVLKLNPLATAPHSGTETEGEIYYDSVTHQAYVWNGTAWTPAGAGAPVTGIQVSTAKGNTMVANTNGTAFTDLLTLTTPQALVNGQTVLVEATFFGTFNGANPIAQLYDATGAAVIGSAVLMSTSPGLIELTGTATIATAGSTKSIKLQFESDSDGSECRAYSYVLKTTLIDAGNTGTVN